MTISPASSAPSHCRDAAQSPLTASAADRRLQARRQLRHSARARLLELGCKALSDVELLSIVLRPSGRQSSRDLERNLLSACGSLRGLLSADRQAALKQGLTLANYASLQAALELARRHYQERLKVGPALVNPARVREFLRMQLRDLPHEVFAILYLDNRHRLIRFRELFRGTIDGASVHPREVVKDALSHNAAAVVLAHNHPSGVAESSQADQLITQRLKQALALVDIRLVDHIIVADGLAESMAERGLI